jgi:hypothetical protein
MQPTSLTVAENFRLVSDQQARTRRGLNMHPSWCRVARVATFGPSSRLTEADDKDRSMKARKSCNFPSTVGLFLVVVVSLSAQEPPRLPLRLKETVAVPQQRAVPISGPIKCDAKGNIYLRSYLPRTNPLAAPVMKISTEGKRTAEFKIDSAPGFEGALVDDFAVDLRGKVYMLSIKGKDELDIVAFGPDGKYDSTIKLDLLFMPGQLAVFRSGEFLVSGEKIDENRQPVGEPFTALFSRNGRLVKELSLPEDVKKEVDSSQEEKSDAASTPVKQESGEFARAISLGHAAPADDGNIYLMRATSTPLVYVISPAGTVLRRLTVEPPSRNSTPVAMKVAGGRLAVLFAQYYPTADFQQHLLSLINAETGEAIAHYVSTPEIGGALACYTPDGLIFLAGTKTGDLVIRHDYPY